MRRDPARAERLCTRAVESFPEEPIGHYNIAMLRMLQDDVEGALDALARDVELGDRDHEYLLEDEVFLPIHENPRSQSLIAEMRESDSP